MIHEDTSPRFVVECDECGEKIGSEEYGGWLLFEGREEAARETGEWDWRLADDETVTCEACIQEQTDTAGGVGEGETQP